MVKVITINILFDLTDWGQRRSLLVNALAAEQADLIALQEVKLPENTAAWLAEQLGMEHVYLVPRRVDKADQTLHGVAILGRYPFVQQAKLDLETQGKVAQFVEVEIHGQPLVFCNGHYYWYPGSHCDRDRQIQQLLAWLGHLPPTLPIIAVGDFNGTPETTAIALMRERFTSAYAACHGQEPACTCPTPLARRNWRKVARDLWRNLIFNRSLIPWKGTLDYIFVNQHLQVKDCRIILNQPDPQNPTLYPSDHFGLVAELEIS